MALPGGLGTFDELCEVLTWAQLGIHAKPIVLLDVDGFWPPFEALLDKTVEAGFVRPAHRALARGAATPSECLAYLAAPAPPPAHKWIDLDEV